MRRSFRRVMRDRWCLLFEFRIPDITLRNEMLKILIADDDRFVRHLLRNFLTNAGHAVFVACNGREAFELANEYEIDLALMDMNMPEVDGWTATRLIKDQIDHRIQIIAVTSYGLPGDQARAVAAGCTRFLAKPIDINLLAEAIADAVKMRENLDASR